jgi:hypothetical protein
MVTYASDLLQPIASVRNSFDRSRSNYMNAHPTFNRNNDARITIYSRCIVAIDSALLHMLFRAFELPEDDWWDSLHEKLSASGLPSNLIQKPPLNDLEKIKKAVDSYWASSYIIWLFSSLESSCRIIIRAVYPKKFNDGRGNLKQIYERLLSTNYPKYDCLLELSRLARNTMHNNGVYFPETIGDNRQVPYNNISYDFIDGQIVQFDDLPKLLFFNMTPDLQNVITDIVNSPEVSKHPQIIDPSV